MSIPEEISFDKEGRPLPGYRGAETLRKVFVPLLVLLVGLLGYGLGRLSGGAERPPVEIRYEPGIIERIGSSTPPTTAQAAAEDSGQVYASSKGTKYYYPGCKSTISAQNKVIFASASAAEAAGYTLASGCKP